MKTVDLYRQKLKSLEDWDSYLLSKSGLPGPRANLELLEAVYLEGEESRFRGYLEDYWLPEQAPVNSPQQFLFLCGIVGIGKSLPSEEGFRKLRQLASDPRWRTREGVCIALQYFGDQDIQSLITELSNWSAGSYLEQRAVIATLCEPRLLRQEDITLQVIELINEVTVSLEGALDRQRDEFKILRQALAYCWSVAVAALPRQGMMYFENWLQSKDKDVQWVMRENLKKKRLQKLDPVWVQNAQRTLSDRQLSS